MPVPFKKETLMARSLLMLLVLALTAVFAALNWGAFSTPTALWLGVTTVQAPVGVVMLFILGVVTAGFAAWVVWLQGTVMLESRRMNKELQSQRDLADRAEASRFTELRAHIDAEMLKVMTRFNELEQRQRLAMEESSNSLSAYIGSLEDRIEHRNLPPESVRPVDRF